MTRKFYDTSFGEGGGEPFRPIFGEWQLCPKCLGNGWMFPQFDSTSVTVVCDVCNGNKLIQKPIINTSSIHQDDEAGKIN